jgi:hypothetical protein
MIRTEYTRQVPIRHWLPVPDVSMLSDDGTVHHQSDCVRVITGYKQQRAWDLLENGHRTYITIKMKTALHQGQDVEGFEWVDEPIVGE